MPDLTLKSKLASEIGRRFDATDHDNQTLDIRALNTSKANKDEVTASLALKADAASTASAINLKADKTTVQAALDLKADQQATQTALSTKASLGQLSDVEAAAFVNALIL